MIGEQKMISAQEARIQTLDNSSGKKISELENQINNAIKSGRFCITAEGVLEPTVKKQLENLGYKINCGNKYNEFYYSISWK